MTRVAVAKRAKFEQTLGRIILSIVKSEIQRYAIPFWQRMKASTGKDRILPLDFMTLSYAGTKRSEKKLGRRSLTWKEAHATMPRGGITPSLRRQLAWRVVFERQPAHLRGTPVK